MYFECVIISQKLMFSEEKLREKLQQVNEDRKYLKKTTWNYNELPFFLLFETFKLSKHWSL